MKRILAFVLGFVVLSGVFLVSLADERPNLTNDEIRETISAGVLWLTNAQASNGRFRYEYIPFLDRYVDDDNMVRQTGAFMVLGEVLKRDVDKKYGLKKVLEKSLEYFADNTSEGDYLGGGFRCIRKDEYKCTLGGTSLALVGLLDLVEVYPSLEGKYLGLIEDYKEHILAMKKDGKGFIESYYLDKRKNDNESSFSNGEALYALVRYYQYEADRKVRDVIADSLEYFLEVYREKWDANFYLWGMVALKDWYGIDPRDEYFEFVKDYTDWRISKYKGMRTTSNNKCAYIEGVVSAYSVLGKVLSDEELAYYLEEIEFWFKKGKELQISEGDFFRVSLNNGRIYGVQVEDWNKSEGGFLTSIKEPVQRIDFTQHCLSGYLQKLVDVDGEGL